MSFDSEARATAPAPLSLQYLSAEIMPLMGGKFSIALRATFLDELELEFVGQDLVSERVETLDQALSVIRQNFAVALTAA